MPKRGTKEKRAKIPSPVMSLRVPAIIAMQAQNEADRLGISLSEYVRRAITNSLPTE